MHFFDRFDFSGTGVSRDQCSKEKVISPSEKRGREKEKNKKEMVLIVCDVSIDLCFLQRVKTSDIFSSENRFSSILSLSSHVLRLLSLSEFLCQIRNLDLLFSFGFAYSFSDTEKKKKLT